ncbi:response regulator [bacterium]|nr:response regulator [bacterium]
MADQQKLLKSLKNENNLLKKRLLELEGNAFTKDETLFIQDEQFSDLLDLFPESIIFISTDRIFYMNPTCAEMLGISSPNEIIGKRFTDFICPDFKDEFNQLFTRMFSENCSISHHEVRLCSSDSKIIKAEMKAFPILFRNKQAAQISFREFSVLQKIEDEIRSMRNIDSFSILIGGIAHNFNNILTSLTGNISIAREFSKRNKKVTNVLEKMEVATHDAKDLMKQMLGFISGIGLNKKLVSLSELLDEIIRYALKDTNISSKYVFSKDDIVFVDDVLIKEAINNIIFNAIEAMNGSGDLEVKVEDSDDRFIKIHIKDSGPGIPEEIISKIFDAGFTTKQWNKGLSLSNSYSVISRHGGSLSVVSHEGLGSEFIIALPKLLECPEEQSQHAYANEYRGKGKILVMDDEIMVREIAGELLLLLGYEVEFVKDGVELLERYKNASQCGEPYDAVIIDLTIHGGMGGKEVIGILLAIDPDVVAIVTSGYENDPVLSNFKSYGFKNVIPKPYNIVELGKTLKQALSENG